MILFQFRISVKHILSDYAFQWEWCFEHNLFSEFFLETPESHPALSLIRINMGL